MPNPRSYTDWADTFKTQHVDANVFNDVHDYISSESLVFCAGPPDGRDIGECWPIGVVENASVVQNKNIQQLFEIGSRKPYFIPGRTITQLGLTRVFLDAFSLLKFLSLGTPRSSEHDFGDNFKKPGIPYERDMPVLRTAKSSRGSEDWYYPNWQDQRYWTTQDEDSHFFINLASDFFNRPLGLALAIRTQEDETYGGVYFTYCYIQSHNFTVAAAQTVVMENVTIRCSEVLPFKI